MGNVGLWLDIQQDSTVAGYHVQQYAYGTSPADGTSNSGLYRVTQVGDTGRYIIRLMLNENLSFGFSGTEVLTKAIPSNDADVSASDTFYITRNGGGYTIQPYGSSYYVSANDTTASGMSGAPDSYLTSRTLASAGNRARWIIEGQYTPIEDGVYAFENFANTNCWIDTEQDFYTPGYHIQQYNYGDIPTVNFNRGALFKISQIGTTGRYVIRSMLNNRMGFGYSGTEIVTKYIPTDDYSVSVNDTFTIRYNNGGYIFRPYGQNNYVSSASSTAFGVTGAPDSYLMPRALSLAGDMARWEMYKYIGSTKYELAFLKGGDNYAGNTLTCTPVFWTTVINANEPYMYVDPELEDVGSGTWNNSSKQLSVLLHRDGILKLHVVLKNGTTTIHTAYVNLIIDLYFYDGCYCIRNAGTKLYSQVDNNGGDFLEQHGISGEFIQSWILTYVSDGYYTIESYYYNDYFLTAPNDSNVGSQIITQPYSSAVEDRQLWRIIGVGDKEYKLQSKFHRDTNLVMAVSNTISGTNITQRQYTNDTDNKDLWNLYISRGPDEVFLLGIADEENNHDHETCLIEIQDDLFELGYNGIDCKLVDSIARQNVTDALRDCRIFVVRAHGGYNDNSTRIFLGNRNLDDEEERLWSYNLYNFEEMRALIDLTDCDLLLFVACSSANHETRSLPRAAVLAGADCAVGFIDEIDCESANKWTKLFFEYYVDGYSVEMSCFYAVNDLIFDGGLDTYVVEN